MFLCFYVSNRRGRCRATGALSPGEAPEDPTSPGDGRRERVPATCVVGGTEGEGPSGRDWERLGEVRT